MTTAVARWERALQDWALPEDVLEAAPESPWTIPAEPLRRRTRRGVDREPSAATQRAREALPEGGTVLDVGVGPGAACLPLADRASRIVGVDRSERLLGEFREAAAGVAAEVRTVTGSWPEVADEVDPADVVVCQHVMYNIPDLAPFVGALTGHAVRRVVVEVTAEHPRRWLADLWERFHGIERPARPTADDLAAALAELGLDASREDGQRPAAGGFASREAAVAAVRRQLCLTADRDDELAAALGDRLARRDAVWMTGPATRRTATFWWEPS